jgi:hypothetical protein
MAVMLIPFEPRRCIVAAFGATFLAFLALPPPALAQDRQAPAERAWYAGAALTTSTVAVCNIFGCLSPDTQSSDTGLGLSVGRQFTRHIAGEIEYLDLGTPAWGDPGQRYHVDVSGYRMSFIWDFPFKGRWSAYVQGGLTRFRTHSRVDSYSSTLYTIRARGTRGSVGGGGEVRVSPAWIVRFGFESSDLSPRLLDGRQAAVGTFLIGARWVLPRRR